MKNERFETVEDLITSDSFCEWIQHQKHHTFWKRWQADDPKRQALIIEAKAFLNQLNFQRESVDVEEINSATSKVWSIIEKTANSSNLSTVPNSPTQPKQINVWNRRWRVAASILALITASWLAWQYNAEDKISYATTYGETEMLSLPDGSEVILQANSTLKVPKNWSIESDRIVSLEGQAFFKVKKIAAKTPVKFTVQTNDFKVEVLGTQFDVLNRPENKRVILQEGKVSMKLNENQTIDLQPNEMATYSKKTKTYKKSLVEASIHTAWTNNKIILNQTPLSEIARLLTDNYGFQVRFSADVDQTTTRNSVGAVPINNVDDLIAITTASYEVTISKKGNEIIFGAVGSRQ